MTRNHRDEVSIDVTSRHEPVTDRMRDYAIEKATKLTRFHDRISRIQIIVDGVHDQPEVEMIVHVDSGSTMVAKERQEHFRAAVDLLVDKLERQIKRDKERLKDHHKGASPKTGAPERGDGSADDTETYDDVIRKDLLP